MILAHIIVILAFTIATTQIALLLAPFFIWLNKRYEARINAKLAAEKARCAVLHE